MFCDAVGATVYPERLPEALAAWPKAAGIPTGTLHTVRHTAAVLVLTAGVPVHIVAARLRNDPKTALTTYADLLPQSNGSLTF